MPSKSDGARAVDDDHTRRTSPFSVTSASSVTVSYTHLVQYFSVGGLALMLLAAIGLVFYYQRQQVRSHRTLMAESSLRRVMSESAVVGLRVTDPVSYTHLATKAQTIESAAERDA